MSERKPEGTRSGHHPVVYNSIQLKWDGETRGEALEDLDPDRDWSPQTKRWWANWRNSAQSMVFHQSDWETLFRCAVLHNRMFVRCMKVDAKTGRFMEVEATNSEMTSLAGEIRRIEEQYGATYADRKKYNYNIEVDDRANEAAVKNEVERAVPDYKAILQKEATPTET